MDYTIITTPTVTYIENRNGKIVATTDRSTGVRSIPEKFLRDLMNKKPKILKITKKTFQWIR